MRVSALLAVMAFSMLPLTAIAAEPQMPAPIRTLVRDGAESRYLGREYGLDGWLTIKNGQEQYFYVTEDGQAILMGVLFNNKGDIVTGRQIEALRKADPTVDTLANPLQSAAPAAESKAMTAQTDTPSSAAPSRPPEKTADTAAPAASGKAQQLYASVESAKWIALGQKTAPPIYSFIDPQCPHCHDMIDDFRKSGVLDKGQVQLRLIPVGLMNDRSLKQAANLIASDNPAADLYRHLGGDQDILMKNPDPNTQNVQQNIALFQEWKLDVTPFSVYRNKNGEIKIIRGRPENMDALISDLK